MSNEWKMEWDLDSHLLEEDIFASFLNTQEPIYELIQHFDAPKEDEDENEDDPESKRIKRLAKNRVSARNTRKKKKQNLQYLESRVASLTEEVDGLRQEVCEEGDEKVNDQMSQQYRSDKQSMFNQLNNLLLSGSHDEQIKDILETLRIKMGANGVERQGYIEYVMHQIADISLPGQLKTLLSMCADKDMSSSLFWDQSLDTTVLTPEQKENIETHLQKITKKKEAYDRCINNLKRIRKCLLRRTGHLQNIIDYISSMLTPRQIAALLVRLNSSDELLDPFENDE